MEAQANHFAVELDEWLQSRSTWLTRPLDLIPSLKPALAPAPTETVSHLPAINKLPVEIWLYILSFLPKHYIRTCMGVHRIFYEIAMDEIHKDLRLVETPTTDFIRPYKDPKISQRVHRIHIRPDFFHHIQEMAPESHRWLSSLLEFKKGHKFKSPSQSLFKWKEAWGELDSKTLALFTGVEEINITLHNVSPPVFFAPFLETLWTTLGPRLQKLSVDLTPGQLPLILDPTVATTLHCLTTFEIRFARSHFPISHLSSVIQHTLLPFTQGLRTTLTSLTVCASEKTNLSCFLSGIGYLPCLTTFSISLFTNQDASNERHSLTAFLSAHSTHIQDLTIEHKPGRYTRTTAYETLVRSDFTKLYLPALRRLSICLSIVPNLAEHSSIVTHVDLARLPRLDTLVIPDAVLECNMIRKILSSLPENGTHMRRLSIKVRTVCLQLMDILAEFVPALEDLTIVCHWGMEFVSGFDSLR
ncbi:hypothetical protein H0H81_011948 [Sphagnurus paluster]|uniref:F-box domain-containing protein n=1 Tax=Sphagnurus paluster TaxID=117069 RepID=A0A9P7GP65_9AGAR|nr:hypothetical protein H0H81_011948 [Sphagnurus paluster]